MPIIPSICMILLLCTLHASAEVEHKFRSSLTNFSRNVFSELVQISGEKSLIYSPFSLQTCLAMVRMGANCKTADELSRGLSFDNQTPETVAENSHTILAKYENSNILKIANKIYVMQDRELQDSYKDVLTNQFFSTAENIDFSQSEATANAINAWVESKTDKNIKNLVSADNFNADTRTFLVSAIYFDGKWAAAFPKEDTQEADFYVDETNSVKVQMMELKSKFDFRHSHKLNAAVVRLPYKDSDLSMLIVVPYERTGLAATEEKLKTFRMSRFVKRLKKDRQIQLRLPKFKAESTFELSSVLKKLGMGNMFVSADLSKMLKCAEPLAIGDVVHKAVIEVSEEGTKAAAATGISSYLRMANPYYPIDAEHPFYYAIINEDGVPLFQGTYRGD